MRYKCKGLAAGSLFQFCFVGFLFFGLAAGTVSMIASYLITGDWYGPQAESSYTLDVGNGAIKAEAVKTTSGLKALLIFYVIFPFTSAITASFLWLWLYVGQFIYTRFKPIQLVVSEKGLGFFSSIKLCFVGIFFSATPLFLTVAIFGSVKMSNDSTLAINEKSFGIGLSIVFVTIFTPLFLSLTAILWGISLYFGQRIFSFFKPFNYRLKEAEANV